jgi:hypothetical protein
MGVSRAQFRLGCVEVCFGRLHTQNLPFATLALQRIREAEVGTEAEPCVPESRVLSECAVARPELRIAPADSSINTRRIIGINPVFTIQVRSEGNKVPAEWC